MSVNIIIPVYNTDEQILERTFGSLSAQINQNFSVTMIDDFSDEKYIAGYERVIDKFHKPVYFARHSQNLGPGGARNSGIEIGPECDHVMFLDADDVLMPNAVRVLHGEINATNADIVMGKLWKEGTHRTEDIVLDPKCNTIWCAGKIYRRKYLEGLGLRFHRDIFCNEDSYFNACALSCTTNAYHIDEVVYGWLENSESLTRKQSLEEYAIKYARDFAAAIIYSIKFINEKRMAPELVAPSLGMLYNTHQLARCTNLDTFVIIEDMIKRELYNEPIINMALSDKKLVAKIAETAKQMDYGYIFKQGLMAWLECYFKIKL